MDSTNELHYACSDDLLNAHIQLSETLRDTHYGHSVKELQRAPEVVEFAKAVGNGTPFVVRGAAAHWPAIDAQSRSRWTNQYLTDTLKDKLVTVSLTGDGYADAVNWVNHGRCSEVEGCTSSDSEAMVEQSPNAHPNGTGHGGPGQFVFAMPFEKQIPFSTVLRYLTQSVDRESCSPAPRRTIAFCQLQNDCLRGPEYESLLGDVPEVVPSWATPVIGSNPEAVNFWMGRHESVSTLHSDPFENIYTVIRGCKIFTLYPPCDLFFFHKQEFPMASWKPCSASDEIDIPPVALSPTISQPDDENQGPSSIPWIPITHPREPAPLYPRFASAPEPLAVRVCAGDSLYLPRGWLHHVEQEEDDEGVCIAVNAWYEGWEGMGISWGWSEYAQTMERLAGHY